MTRTETEWRACKLDNLGFVGRGKSRHRPRNDASLYGGKYPFFQTGDIKAANFHLTEYSQTYSDKGLAQSKLWQPGTLCITIAANIAETAILGIPGCFPDSVVGFVADREKADVRFVKYFIDTLKLQMQSVSRGTTQDNLSVDKLLTFDFFVPSLPVQQQIAGILSTYDELMENNVRRIRILEEMARSLYREWFVDFRFPGNESVPLVYESTEAARKVLRQNGFAVDKHEDGESHQFVHTLMICEILASIELGARGDPGVRFVPWLEILAKAPESTRKASYPLRIPVPEGKNGYLVPDAVFGLEYQMDGRKTYRFFALEADRNTMPVLRSSPEQSSYRRKIISYREIIARQIHKSCFGFPNLLVLTVTTNERHKEQIMKLLVELTDHRAPFLFKTLGAPGSFNHVRFAATHLLLEPWPRVGHPPLCIGKGH